MSNATNSEDRLESILGQVRVLKAKYDERAEVTGENFNVFSILDKESDEVKTHSAIIAELLNPHGSHSQGTLFLKLFLGKLLKKLQEEQKVQKELEEFREKLEQIKDNEYDKFKVGVEVSFEKKGQRSRIDILLESDDVCIVIENKIYAEDQERQLGRYYEYALDTGKKLGIIYLTLRGDEPEERTLYGDEPDKIPPCRRLPVDTVVCLSYEKFIDEWLGACIKEVARIPQIRETLHQYQMTVKKLTGQPINRRFAVELKKILLEDKNYNLIPDLKAALSEAQTDLRTNLQYKFLSRLESRIKTTWKELNVVDKNLRYEVYRQDLVIERKTDLTSQHLPEDELKADIKKCSTQSCPGLTFRVYGNENCEIVFRIECEPKYLSYGFVLCEKGKDLRVKIDNEKLDKYQKHIDKYKIDDEWEKNAYSKGWLAYKYWEYPEIHFESVEKDEERNLNLVDEICKVIRQISK